MAPLGYGHMRSAQADRERAIDVLKAAFAEGRLDQDEYAGRVGQVYASRTYGELAALTADLPAGPLGTLAQLQASSPPQYLSPVYRPAPSRSWPSPLLIPLLVFAAILAVGAVPELIVAAFPVLMIVLVIALLRPGRRWR
jgi:hypothetical protein